MTDSRSAVFRHLRDCPAEEWSSPTKGTVRWWELIGGDLTPTDEITVGIAEVPVGAKPPPRGHRHDATEVYVILSGQGDVVVEGVSNPVGPGSAVWIPEGLEHFAHNTGIEPLRLLYIFARDRFSDVTYCFPAEEHGSIERVDSPLNEVRPGRLSWKRRTVLSTRRPFGLSNNTGSARRALRARKRKGERRSPG